MAAESATPWGQDHPEIELLNRAIAVGITPETIIGRFGATFHLGLRPLSYRDSDWLEGLIAKRKSSNPNPGPNARTTAAPRPATDRQIAYILNLLAARKRTGEEGGMTPVGFLYDADGHPNEQAVRKLTSAKASLVIDSLRGTY
jgi:hypothetical protein